MRVIKQITIDRYFQQESRGACTSDLPEMQLCIRARSQIPVYGLTGRGLGGRSATPGTGFRGKVLE